MEKIFELKECVEKISKEAHKFFEKNNKISGVRARKELQKCKKLAQEIRIGIQKSKQEQVQKKAAVAAASAAVSGAGILTEGNLNLPNETIPSIKVSQYNSFVTDSNAHVSLLNESTHTEFIYQDRHKKENSSQLFSSYQNRTRLDDIPTWNENKVDLFN
ncbi:hypothetical protein HAN_2g360 (nucleomorph) [Hemiselmis andersenii]|uniref:Uncharacterized protein n=1 Tax=Hemiselmis andersenii TaxID=464988 RepID=A9BKK5_HEMAN|nr:hypothetical protein HAN_2g360 [Hemiselmis andersenii]ABW98176.1 hypothetical protein HAN_2g360 [Hemiselmis andersenii]